MFLKQALLLSSGKNKKQKETTLRVPTDRTSLHYWTIMILPVSKDDFTIVMEKPTHREKLFTLVDDGVYEPLSKDPTSKLERKVQKLLSKHKLILSTGLKKKLIPYHSKQPHLYGLPKIHKPNTPLRPTVCSICSPCYALTGFLQQILNPLSGKTDSFVKNSEHFIQFLKCVKMGGQDIGVSSNVVSLFTNLPVNEALQITYKSTTLRNC
jgi:hypothetical protein